jgi:hypothetical protein
VSFLDPCPFRTAVPSSSAMAPSQTRKLCTNDRRGSSGNHMEVRDVKP